MRRVRLDNGPLVSKRGPSVRATRDGGIRSRSTCSSMRSKMNPAVPAMTIRLSRPLAKGAIMARPARAAAWICAGILAVACSGPDAPTSPTVPQSSAFVLSSPQLSGSAASNHGATAATGPGDVVYVSLPPGSIPNAGAITIRVEPGGALVNANAVDGGFDPVAVPAAAGDTLYIEVQVPGKSPVLNIMPVPKTGHPVVIRTSPPTQKRDVPLNANILVVFSEPITLSSWNANTVQLTQGSTAIPSSAGFQDADHLMATLTPTGPLGAGTDYTLTINQGVQDFAGQGLPAPVTVQFTTAGAKPIDTLPHATGPGSFAATGQMSTKRGQHTATLLANGKVLIAGGVQSTAQDATGVTLATAELYDPATGLFSATGSMAARRRMPSATLLLDGRVLIAGGFDGSSALSSTELYDPTTGTFRSAGNMITARGDHDGILLDNGTVLFVGGWGGSSSSVPPAEIYDPTTDTFTPTGPYMGGGACDFCAPSVLLSNGSVLFTGQSPAQLYDPRGGVFIATGFSSSDGESAATLLMNGKVLFAGGEGDGRLSAAELFDPRLGTFASTGSMASPRVWHTLTLLPDGTVLTAGGETDRNGSFAGSVASAEVYDPTSGAFSRTGSMTAARETHTATLLDDGRVLLAGGVSYGGIGLFYGSLATAELYTPAILVPAPTVLTVSGDSSSPGAIVHAATGLLVTADNPAVAGELLQIPCTHLNDGSSILPRVIIGGALAELLSSTSANDATGVTRLTVRMPTLVGSDSGVRVLLRYIGRTSNPVMLAARPVVSPGG